MLEFMVAYATKIPDVLHCRTGNFYTPWASTLKRKAPQQRSSIKIARAAMEHIRAPQAINDKLHLAQLACQVY
jgi:hypothetical protein